MRLEGTPFQGGDGGGCHWCYSGHAVIGLGDGVQAQVGIKGQGHSARVPILPLSNFSKHHHDVTLTSVDRPRRWANGHLREKEAMRWARSEDISQGLGEQTLKSQASWRTRRLRLMIHGPLQTGPSKSTCGGRLLRTTDEEIDAREEETESSQGRCNDLRDWEKKATVTDRLDGI